MMVTNPCVYVFFKTVFSGYDSNNTRAIERVLDFFYRQTKDGGIFFEDYYRSMEDASYNRAHCRYSYSCYSQFDGFITKLQKEIVQIKDLLTRITKDEDKMEREEAAYKEMANKAKGKAVAPSSSSQSNKQKY